MIILGINASHVATACLLVDGEITSCISEERLTRVKNQGGLPVLAIKEILRINGYYPKDIDLVVFGTIDPKTNFGFASVPNSRDKGILEKGNLSEEFKKMGWILKEDLLINIPQSRYFYDNWLPVFYKFFLDQSLENKLLLRIEKEIGIPKEKIIKVDHHTAHAYSAIFTSPNFNKKTLLALTLDGMGDGLCSTVRVINKEKIKIIAETIQGNSLGDFYSEITYFLGMKPGEHEYKVMGLAPYANQKYAENLYLKLREFIWVNDNLTFSTKVHSHMFYKIIPKILHRGRFDNIAAAIQLLTERLVVEWVSKAIRQSGVNNVVCAGGVFMNVKMNQKILELPEVKSLYVIPSCGDETTAIGAAYFGYKKLSKGKLTDVKLLKSLYLGTEYSDMEISKEVDKLDKKKYKVKKHNNIERAVAKLLVKGKVVARFSGPMEFGARALGNRSILAHPANMDSIREINESIKNRDFWMPFAPVVLEERQFDYFKNPKKYPAYFMMITFDTTEKGKKDLKAAMHQYDFTLRPQIVQETTNPNFHKLISEFEKLTGIGGVLNTSFNLHGYPIVMSPKDALEVLDKSGLIYLAIGNFIVRKNEK